MLGKIKLGDADPDILDYLVGLNRPLNLLENGIKPTQLCTHRLRVNEINDAEFRKLKTQTYTFDAIDWGRSHKEDGSGARDIPVPELNRHCKSSYSLTYYLSNNCNQKIQISS